jgi:hypothetical protein
MNVVQSVDARQRLAELPASGGSLVVRLDCCGVDLPARVVGVQGMRVSISAPIHLCSRPELGSHFAATWDCKTGVARATGTVESQRRVPPTWVLHIAGPIERLDVEPRFPDDSPGLLDLGDSRLPARIIDRSLHGVACLVPALAPLKPGQRVRVTVGRHERAGTIARVRPFGNQLRVGIRLDEV